MCVKLKLWWNMVGKGRCGKTRRGASWRVGCARDARTLLNYIAKCFASPSDTNVTSFIRATLDHRVGLGRCGGFTVAHSDSM